MVPVVGNGVGAVISRNYGGWNTGLAQGGFGGLAIGTVLMAVMYLCMVFTIAELSAALPHAGGFFSLPVMRSDRWAVMFAD
ncbi:MAG: hypothetical protein R3C11_14330 [Planctomycetaceae bacterium]